MVLSVGVQAENIVTFDSLGQGAIKVVSLYTGGSKSLWTGELTFSMDNSALTSFCVEIDENIKLKESYYFDKNTEAIHGGLGGGNPDPLDAGTAWIYNEYVSGNAYNWSAVDTQLAIWEIEQEIILANGVLNNDNTVYDITAAQEIVNQASGAIGIGMVRIMNLWHDQERNDPRQDILCIEDFEIYIDIKPQSCPNPLNTNNQGLTTVAVLGTEHFNIYDVDVSTLTLEGVVPIRYDYEDVTTPLIDKEDECDCNTEGPDSWIDLTLKFNVQEIIEALGDVEDGDVIPVTLKGMLLDGTSFEASDCIVIREKKESGDNKKSKIKSK